MNEKHEAVQELTKVQTRRASLSVNATLRPLLWGLVHRLPVLCDHIVGRLGRFGVGPSELRVDNGDGTVGGFNVAFWALDYQIRCTIRLAGAEVHCHAMEQVDVETFDDVVQSVLEAVEKTDENVVVQNYDVNFQIHARTTDTTPREYLKRFVKHEPKGLGPWIGNAVSFAFGANGKRTSCSIAADFSREFVDAIFIDGRVNFDGSRMDRRDLKSEAADYVKESLATLDLTLQAGATE